MCRMFYAQVCRARVMPHKINVGLVALAAVAAAVLADPTVDRRASMGFMGMRGKKDDQGGSGNGDETSAAAVELDKRTLVYRRPLLDDGRPMVLGGGVGGSAEGFKRAMGFMGMRGKKEYYKGPSAAGFFGMRGKKGPSSSAFFGMRGKKSPSSSAFFGVRGKKSQHDLDSEVVRAILYRIFEPDRGKRTRTDVV